MPPLFLVLLEREPLLRDDADLPAPDVEDLARDEPDLLAPTFDALLRDFAAPVFAFDALLFDAADPDFEVRDELLFEPFDAVELRPPAALPELLLDLLEPELALVSIDHLPLITRCAASATASAMIEPSLVALDIMLPAARSAVSAASSPASRIFLRAAGLALIAAAAAARPAASISLLIAALASLSTVLSSDFERDDDDLDELEREELFLADLAMFFLPPLLRKDTLGPFRFPNEVPNRGCNHNVKGTAALKQRCPSTWSAAGDVAVRQLLGLTNTPFRPPC